MSCGVGAAFEVTSKRGGGGERGEGEREEEEGQWGSGGCDGGCCRYLICACRCSSVQAKPCVINNCASLKGSAQSSHAKSSIYSWTESGQQ